MNAMNISGARSVRYLHSSNAQARRGRTNCAVSDAVVPRVEPHSQANEDFDHLLNLQTSDLMSTDGPELQTRHHLPHTSVHGVILAGGSQDTPLSSKRGTPSWPIGGNFYLIDAAVGTCIDAGINKMHVLTQFNSQPLHSHLSRTYPRMCFGGGSNTSFVDVIACTQTPVQTAWSQGSADALRRALPGLHRVTDGLEKPTDVLVLSGHDVHDIDFNHVIQDHQACNADVTIVTKLQTADKAQSMGTCTVAPDRSVKQFIERPMASQLDMLKSHDSVGHDCSLGIYVFKYEALERLLLCSHSQADDMKAIGNDLIPFAMHKGMNVVAHRHEGSYLNCTNLVDYMHANIHFACANGTPQAFHFMSATSLRMGQCLPPSRLKNLAIQQTLISEGCILRGGSMTRSVIGARSYIGKNCNITDSLVHGLTSLQSTALRQAVFEENGSAPGIGDNVTLKNVIVDFDACIGDNVQIVNNAKVTEADLSSEGIMIQNGITVVLNGAVIPDGFCL